MISSCTFCISVALYLYLSMRFITILFIYLKEKYCKKISSDSSKANIIMEATTGQ